MNDPVRKLLLLSASVAASLVVAEVSLRVIAYGERAPVINVDDIATAAMSAGRMKEDPKLLWRLSRCDAYCEAIAQAHPGNTKLSADARGRKRILCLGDSCTFLGWERVPPYSVLLEWLFRRDGAGVDVLNAGVPGYSSTQGLIWLRTELLKYKPDLVTVFFGWNDHWRAHSATDSRYVESLSLHPLRLVRLARNAAELVARRPRPALPPFRVPPAEYAGNLKEIQRLVTESGGRCLFLTAPALAVPRTRRELVANHHLDGQDDYMGLHEQYNDVVRGLGRDGLAVLDLAAVFQRAAPPAPLMRADGIHFTGAGHNLAASAIHDEIIARGLLK